MYRAFVSIQRSFSFPLRGWSLLNVVLLVLLGASCTQRTKVYDTPPESCVLGAVAGVGFKLIASQLSSQSAFEITKFAFSLPFSVLPSIVYMQFPIILLQFKKCFSHSKVSFYLSHFPYFAPGKHSCPDASCNDYIIP